MDDIDEDDGDRDLYSLFLSYFDGFLSVRRVESHRYAHKTNSMVLCKSFNGAL